MKDSILRLRERYDSDYRFKTYLSSACSAVMGIGFALFNAVLGIMYKSVWNGSISVYYMLLAIVRGIIVTDGRRPFPFNKPRHVAQKRRTHGSSDRDRNRRICIGTHIIMIVMDLCLIAPIAYMVMGERTYRFGLIPAIGMAVYTCYRVTMSVIHYRSSGKQENLLVKELRVINLQDALVAVLTLQNALIIANGSCAASMILLTGWTSAGIWLLIVYFTLRSFPDTDIKRSFP